MEMTIGCAAGSQENLYMRAYTDPRTGIKEYEDPFRDIIISHLLQEKKT